MRDRYIYIDTEKEREREKESSCRFPEDCLASVVEGLGKLYIYVGKEREERQRERDIYICIYM